jgi:hypothetical protein
MTRPSADIVAIDPELPFTTTLANGRDGWQGVLRRGASERRQRAETGRWRDEEETQGSTESGPWRATLRLQRMGLMIPLPFYDEHIDHHYRRRQNVV